MKEFMALGYSVKIDELGTFCAQLRLGSGKERETLDENEAKRNAQSIIVGNVGYIPARKFVSNIRCACRLERDGAVKELKKSPYSADERISLALKYLDVHPFMTVSDYASITRQSYPSAIRELHKLRTDPASGIRAMGRAPHLVYVRRE
ncbi:MAG: DNA-binding protein [Bacteroidaceae bacterium]|nr:DNA-binding protein [Bacteroidaceae bacterium]